jgi:hypothetical protein
MSALHDLILALPEGATLEITRGEIEDSVVIALDIVYRKDGVTLGSDLVLNRNTAAHRVLARMEIDAKARVILHDPRFAGVPACTT